MRSAPQVLICDDDSVFQLTVKQALKPDYECRTAYDSDEALAILRKHPIDIVLLDIQMRTPEEGLEAIPKFLALDPALSIVMVSALTDFATMRRAMGRGAVDYVGKSFEAEDLRLTLNRMLERRQLLIRDGQRNFEAATAQRRHAMVGESAPLRALRATIAKFRASPANVLIQGETGAGKEVVARQLRRTLADGTLEPFVAVDSATIQSSTAESQLFGHEKGAFTGADRAAKGLFEEADGGTLYFDEIANMPLGVQAKLLRVLQEKEICRLGSTKTLPLEFRVICATNRDLGEMARRGEFKDDLLQRINVLPLALPALREHPEDVPALAAHFLAPLGRALSFSADALAALQAYAWPGNVRELANLVAYVAAMVEPERTEVELADLPPRLREPARAAGPAPRGFYEQVAAFERSLLKSEYEKAEGNVSQLALQLGMDRSHLHAKLKEYGIHSARTKSK